MNFLIEKRSRKFEFSFFIFLAVCFLTPQIVASEPLTTLLDEILKTDPRIVQANYSNQISENSRRSAYGEWLPAVDLTGHYGYEEIHNEPAATDNTYFETRKFQAQLTQMIFDYSKMVGLTQAKTNKELNDLTLEATRQSIILGAVSAYFNVVRTGKQLQYAKASESNIFKQAGMEESRLKKGGGVSTDVLQVKSQLAGARANRVRTEGAFKNALNNYRRVFRRELTDPSSLSLPKVPFDILPQSLEDTIQNVKDHNLNLKQTKISVDLAELALKSKNSSFMPTVKLIAQSQYKIDNGGTEFGKDEHLVKLDFSYSLFNGGKDYYDRQNKILSILSAQESLKESMRTIEESGRNFWENYITARSRAQFLQKQAKTAGEFLGLARKERKLGKRSLLDVLNGETNYIQSISNAVSADTDMSLAVYNLFFIMGKLDQDLISKYSPEAPQS